MCTNNIFEKYITIMNTVEQLSKKHISLITLKRHITSIEKNQSSIQRVCGQIQTRSLC